MRVKGFTLVEVLVALIVVALGAAAVMSALSTGARAITRVEERAFAEWVALNVLTETRLSNAALAVGETRGEQMLGGRAWVWIQRITDTAIPDIVQINVEVSPAVGSTLRASGLKVEIIGARSVTPGAGGSPDRLWDEPSPSGQASAPSPNPAGDT
jgi:general secretion pathway protein I